MAKPTETAQIMFQRSYDLAIAAANHLHARDDKEGRALYDMAGSLAGLAKGLNELSIGVRATYMAIEQLTGGAAASGDKGGNMAGMVGSGMLGGVTAKILKDMFGKAGGPLDKMIRDAMKDSLAQVGKTLGGAGKSIGGLVKP